MSKTKPDQSLVNLERALDRLEQALREPQRNKLAVDGTIQRFEFAIELFWKCFKRLLLKEGIETMTPRESLQKAFQAGWFLDETLWLQMLKDRNETSHVYDEAMAKRIYQHIKKYFPEMKLVYSLLQERVKKNEHKKR